MRTPTNVERTPSSGRRSGRLLLALLVSFAFMATLVAASAGLASAATLTVTTNNDSGPGSLRQTITDASSGDTITFAQGVTGTIYLTSGELRIDKNLTIQGPGANTLAVSGDNNVPEAHHVFYISPADVVISGLTITGGATSGGPTPDDTVGGGIYNSGTLTLIDTTVRDNRAGGGNGIYNSGTATLTLIDTTVSNNDMATFGEGGGIYNAGGTAALINSTVSGNRAYSGGGIFNSGTLRLTNSTVSGNTSQYGYGSRGAGIFNYASTTTLGNTIVASNKIFLPWGGEDPDDVYGSVSTKGHNLIGTGDGSSGLTNGQNGDQVGTDTSPIDPKLGPLADNGGSTLTRAPLPGSPAIDAGDNSLAVGPDGTALAFDQRGEGFTRIQGAAVDIGAFEVVQADTTAPTVATVTPANGATNVAKTANVTATFSEKVQNVNTSSFKLERKIVVKKGVKWEPIAATVTPADGIVEEGANATLKPNLALPKGTYRVTITSGVTDMANPANALVSTAEHPSSVTFTITK